MQNQSPQSSELILCCDHNNFNSLVMLAPHHHILDRILKIADQPYYLWIYEDKLSVQKNILNLQKQIQQRSLVFQSLEAMKSQIIHNINSTEIVIMKNKIRKAIIICQNKFVQSAITLTRRQQIIGVVQYCFHQNQDQVESSLSMSSEDLEYFYFEQQIEYYDCQYYHKCYDLAQLQEFLLQNEWYLSDTQQFPYFMSIRDETEKPTMLVYNIMAMINQNTDSQTRYQIFNQLDQVIMKLQKQSQHFQHRYSFMKQIIDKLKQQKLSLRSVFSTFADEDSKFYIIVNTFLKAMRCPTQIFYVQPYLKELFNFIKKINQTIPPQEFVCYRGAYVNHKQIEKLYKTTGDIVRNFGFFSTSLSQNFAMKFKKNIIYEIKGKHTVGSQNGFALNLCQCQFFSHKQILFNPLNNFKVCEVKTSIYQQTDQEHQTEYKVVFAYGQNECLQPMYQTKQELINKIILQYEGIISKNLSSQGEAFLDYQSDKKLILALFYWQKCIQQKQKIKCSSHLEVLKKGQSLNKLGKYQEALITFDTCEAILNQQNHQNTKSYYNLSNYIGLTLIKLGKYDEALNKLQECEIEIANTLGEEHHLFRQILYSKSWALYKLGQYRISLNNFMKCLSLSRKAQQDSTIQYFNILQSIVIVLCQIGDCKEVLKYVQDCLAIYAKIIDRYNKLPLNNLNNHNSVLDQIGQLKVGQQILYQCLLKLKEAKIQTLPLFLSSLNNESMILDIVNRYHQAYQLLTGYLRKQKNSIDSPEKQV